MRLRARDPRSKHIKLDTLLTGRGADNIAVTGIPDLIAHVDALGLQRFTLSGLHYAKRLEDWKGRGYLIEIVYIRPPDENRRRSRRALPPVSVAGCGVPHVLPERWRVCTERRFTFGKTARSWPRSHRCLTSVIDRGAPWSTRASCDGGVTNSD